MNFAKKSTFPNFLGGILLVCYKGYLTRPNPVEKASVAICSVKKHKMPVSFCLAHLLNFIYLLMWHFCYTEHVSFIYIYIDYVFLFF